MTTPEIRVGTVGYPTAKKAVWGAVDIVELTGAREAPPRPGTGRKWRSEAPTRLGFSIQAPRALFEEPPRGSPLPGNRAAYGGFRTSDENLALWEATLRFAEAIEAGTLVILSPAEFTPSGANRSALQRFMSEVERGDIEIVWEPRGPWEPERAAEIAAGLGLTLAVDPLRDAPPPAPTAYLRLGPFSSLSSRLGIYDLERLRDTVLGFQRATCVFETPRALDDARNLKKFLAERAGE
jgi:uncharacterized protein YecE (DUF72 family)